MSQEPDTTSTVSLVGGRRLGVGKTSAQGHSSVSGREDRGSGDSPRLGGPSRGQADLSLSAVQRAETLVDTPGDSEPSGGPARSGRASPNAGRSDRLDAEVSSSLGLAGELADSSPSAALARMGSIDRQEHQANLIRFRRAITLGVLFWPAFALVDWAMASGMGYGHLAYLLEIRFALVPLYVLFLWRVLRPPDLSPFGMWAIDLTAFGTASGAISLMSVRLGGLESVYFGGVIVTIVCRGALVTEPLGRGLQANLTLVGAWAGTLLLSALFEPQIAAQLGSARALVGFGVRASFVITSALLMALAGNALWSMRRQVFEARNIGRYRLRKRIGKGGMGEVWSAWHGAIRREVAVKLLRPDVSRSADAVQRFEREVAATAELAHPNTVRVFDYGVTGDGIWYYVMELLDGENLSQRVERDGALPEQTAVHIAHQAARALAEAHARSIVHRDVKPENIFLARAGGETDIVKVLDFGIAKVAQESPSDHSLTRTGAVVGTPAYMSPEAARGASTDARTDVYSLGAVLYFMLAGRPPFRRDSFAETLLAQINDVPEPLAQARGEPVHPLIEELVRRCLQKSPADRFQRISDLADGLEECAAALRGPR